MRTILICIAVVAFLSGLVILAARGRANLQERGPSTPASLQPAERPATNSARRPEGDTAESAAASNPLLARTIEWQFGGKTQRGWYLYVPLIQRIVGSDAALTSDEFARAVARWQKRVNLSPADGRVTEACWLLMMQGLQQARTRDATLCPAAELVPVSAELWFDPERPAEQRYLRRDAYDAYLRMVAAARADLGSASKGYFSIISGHRSPAYQAKLRALAGGNPSTASLARNSPHFTGRAIDIYVGGEPVSTVDSNRAIQVATPAYQWLAQNAHRFGFRPYFYEPWHWEYDPRLAGGQ